MVNEIKDKFIKWAEEWSCFIVWVIIFALFYWIASSVESHSVICVNGVEYIEPMIGSITPSYDLDGSIKSCES